jgi:signal transduction histidine kinase
MVHTEIPPAGADPLAFLAGGGEMGERIRAFDWPKTPLGPAESWSPALRTVVRLMLANRLPMLLWWGPHYVSIYNDSYRPVLGNKHPWGLGLPVRECWGEIWHVLKPLIDTPFHGGPATWDEDILLVINRYGFNEETHWLIAYSPVPDESAPGGIGGVLATVHETTEKVLSERRMTALRDLGSRPAEAKTAEAACAVAAKTLAAHGEDIPFALLYLTDADGRQARLAANAGIAAGQDVGQQLVDLDVEGGAWPLAEARRTMLPQVVADLGTRFPCVPPGPWPDPPTRAVVLPIGSGKPHEPAGFLVAGLSSRLRLDDAYLGFLGLVTTQVATAIANARAYEEEKRRAESLAEIDRAKTTFFSNVSHEFRTPLTLILGPLDDALNDAKEPRQRDRLLTLQRNALRLQKLVNTLLDFSRIEAGRVQVNFQPVDLSALTRELASNFQSACEKAGLELVVDCAALPEPVYVDAEMWEKIVLNLVSNAFKFTLKGCIEVALRRSGPHAELVVRDTGVGIPADQMARLFERFHRVEGVTGRTQEGSGIGLALVRELVRLHGGSVDAQSEFGLGTTFLVTLPLGAAHLARERVGSNRTLASTAIGASPFVEEALRWLPDQPDHDEARTDMPRYEEIVPVPVPAQAESDRPRVLVADDNADMRRYVVRLLCDKYTVEAVSDGEVALTAARRQTPDLILSDVMMPRLDGFGLLRKLRADPRTVGVPFILLSARAGEESRVEGMEAGADDYLVKPFSARELVARVSAHLQMARLRRDADRRKDEFLAILAHELRNPLAPIRNGLQVMKLASNDGSVVEQARVMMERQLGHMARLIDDLMDVSRISRGKVELRRGRVELARVVQQAVETSRPLIEQMGHELTLDVPPAPIFVNGDLTRLAQVFANLLNNAAKYTERGGRITLRVERQGSDAVLSVRDTGVGIPAHMLPRVFEMFTQVDQSLERSQGGLGIGLSLVKGLVEMHGGRVEARSDGHGTGSEFVVRLPVVLSPAARQPGDEADRAPAAAKARRRILVADDNRDSAGSLALLLRYMGNDTQTAHDGLEALDVAAAFRPDVILLDIGMPKLNGYETARRIRQQPWGRHVVLVAQTGWGQEDDKRLSREAGFDFHMVKPVDPAELESVLAVLKEAR